MAHARPQKRRRLPGLCRGEPIGAIAMTEPDGGADVHAIRTRAVRTTRVGFHQLTRQDRPGLAPTIASSGTLAVNWTWRPPRWPKPYLTEGQCEIVDRCLQIFGGYGCTTEHPIARMYADARVHKIYDGTDEIMKELIARAL
ncbi:hypothetical protein Ate01nite_47590 [Actinoplanes teichomyceticus]|nr:hypothetical protein Ate01nite_47590 [Actinoplanes teichomyceticus]